MKNYFIGFLILYANLLAQIDTSDYYPLHIGDKWEYLGIWNNERYSVEVVGDTLMENGFKYFIITNVNYTYQRVENNKYVKAYNEFEGNNEFVIYDLASEASTIFNAWGSTWRGYGIYETGIDNNNLINKELEWREFREVWVDSSIVPPDTVWYDVVDAYWPRITKGIGFTTYGYGLDILIGVRINNVGYGTLTNIDNEKMETPVIFDLCQNYPNPFNPSTNITYQIPTGGNVSLKVYDVLGKEVAVLVDEYKDASRYSVNFNGCNLASGVYLYKLQAGSFVSTKKLVLMK